MMQCSTLWLGRTGFGETTARPVNTDDLQLFFSHCLTQVSTQFLYDPLTRVLWHAQHRLMGSEHQT